MKPGERLTLPPESVMMERGVRTKRERSAIAFAGLAIATSLLLVLARASSRAPHPARDVQASLGAIPEPVRSAPEHASKPAPQRNRRARPELHVRGPTPFTRRLAAGAHFLRLRAEWQDPDADRIAILRDFDALSRHLLRADGIVEEYVGDALRQLTSPRRDRDALQLAEGRSGLVRVWTLDEPFDADVVQRTEAFVAGLVRATGHPMREGVDVLVTPGAGEDLFPTQYIPGRAAGIYFRRDRYCVVRADLEARWREDVIRHEVVHAYVRGPIGIDVAPRLVTEGLAEYLRLVVRDGSLRVPASHVRDHLARLHDQLVQMDACGVRFDNVDVERLVNLPPWLFYRLPFAYPLALAMHVYVGEEPIERMLRSRSAGPLVKALEEVEWPTFREWLARNASGGDAYAARFVRDAMPAFPQRQEQESDVRGALRAIGCEVQPDVDPYRMLLALESPDRIRHVIEGMLDPHGGPLVIATDMSAAMDRPLAAVRFPAAWGRENIGRFVAETPRDVVASVHQALHRAHAKTTLIPLSDPMEPMPSVQRVLPYAPAGLARWLWSRNEPGLRLVVCFGPGADSGARRELADLRLLRPRPESILIIDLGRPGSVDAQEVARALAEQGLRLSVAYWRPEAPETR